MYYALGMTNWQFTQYTFGQNPARRLVTDQRSSRFLVDWTILDLFAFHIVLFSNFLFSTHFKKVEVNLAHYLQFLLNNMTKTLGDP